ncbi:MAG: acyl-CoA thioesterase, partial [Metallosphaera sp.]
VPVKIGDILEIQGAVEYTGNTSLDVGAKIFAINHFTGTRRLVSRTVFSFVSIDDQGKPRPISKLEPSSEYERSIMENRIKEREERIKLSKTLQQRACQ